MIFGKKLSVEERETKCYEYFHTNCIKNRDQLRSSLKETPLTGVNTQFAEIMLTEYLEHQRQVQKQQEERKFKPTDRRTAVVINDLHIPYHDEISLNLVFDCIIDLQPNYLILNGDILDFYGCSKFAKQPDRMIMLQDEIDIFYKKFRNLMKYIPETEVHYTIGNHEARMTTIMKENPSLYNLDVLQPETLLKLDKLGIYCHDEEFTLNDFTFSHGDVVRQEASYSARQECLEHDWGRGMSAHTHRLGSYYRTFKKHVKFWYENGCLCTLEPDYFKNKNKVNWQQGFSVIDMYDDLNQVTQILIQDHKFVYNGKLYK